MEANTDAHSPQPTRHLGRFVVSRHRYVRSLYYSRLKSQTSELLGPAVLRRTTYVLLAASDCDWVLLLSCCLALCPLTTWQAFHIIVLSYRYRTIACRSRYRITAVVSVWYYRIVIEQLHRNFRYDIQH